MNNNKVKKPKIYLLCSIIWFLLWTPITIWIFYEMIIDKYYVVLPIVLAFAFQIFFSIFLFMYTINWCIEILNDEVIITNWRNKKSKYTLKELSITYRRVLDDSIVLWNGIKKVTIIGSFDTNFKLVTKFKIKK